MHTRLEIEVFLATRLSERMGIEVSRVDHGAPFTRYGLDSLGVSALLTELGVSLGRTLSPMLAWTYPSIQALARHLTEGTSTDPPTTRAPSPEHESIAVIGMSCRFPQAPSLTAFWHLLRDGVDAVTETPKERWDAAGLSSSDHSVRGTINSRRGGFLDRVEMFDPLFFGISPTEAIQIDPQQRLMMELSWEALEDAGYPPDSRKEIQTGVYFGVMWLDYATLIQRNGLSSYNQHTAMGFLRSLVANRISYVLGLQGPSMALDTACSSSLVAVHLACQSLRRGETTMALVGGVNLNLLPDSNVIASRAGALSPDGRCYTFDARANGCIRGEGGGVVVLKPLRQAIADNNPIYCVIRGSAVNNDGPSNGLTAPNPQAQEAMLWEAYANAAVAPVEVDYVELHGTGTPLGDPIEAGALGRVLCADRPPDQPLLVGSVKTNIGHLDSAAGVAGFIKAALCLQHRTIPPSLHYETRNPHIPQDLPLQVQSRLSAWPARAAGRGATAGVSSFGMGGTNCHVVLQEVLPPRVELYAISSDSPEGLRETVQQHTAWLDGANAESPPSAWWQPPGEATRTQRFRLAAWARSSAELRQSLATYLRGSAASEICTGSTAGREPQGPFFVFSGQGAQWVGMGRSLLQQERVVRAQLERCDRLIRNQLGWSLLTELLAPKGKDRFDHAEVTIPAIVALEIAVAALLGSWGVKPSMVMGHSIGEIAAAQVAGVLTLEDAMRVACTIGHVTEQIHGQGAMGLAALSWSQAVELVADHEGLHPAIEAGPAATVLSGTPSALAEVFSVLERRGVFCRRIHVHVAAHSPQLHPLAASLLQGMAGVRPRPAQIPIFSVTSIPENPGERFGAEHWVRNVSEPVYFHRGITGLIAQGHQLFVELAPNPILQHSIEGALREAGTAGAVFPLLRRDTDERESLLRAVGALYVHGQPLRSPIFQVPTDCAPEEDRPGPSAFHILPLSARSEGALLDLAKAYQALLGGTTPPSISDIAYTASARRSHHPHRLAVVGSTPEQWQAALAAAVLGERYPGVMRGRARPDRAAKVAFVFSGHGSQWNGMGRRLLAEEPIFRAAMESCERAIQEETGRSILSELASDAGSEWLERSDLIQPVLFSLQVSLAALWRAWGVTPDAVLGTSMGEVAAAQVCGALGLKEAVRLICRRSQLLLQMRGKGAMAVVELSAAETQQLADEYAGRLSVAASNGPRSTVLSGEPQAIESALVHLEQKGIFCRRLQGGNAASHSPQVDGLRDELLALLGDLRPGTPEIPMISTVTTQAVTPGILDAEYWFRNLREPVLLWPTVSALCARHYDVFIEVSPHPVLLPALQEGLTLLGGSKRILGTLHREQPERRSMLETLGELYARGQAVEWERLYHADRKCVSLPTYPWQRQRYWVEEPAPAPAGDARQRHGDTDAHPLLGAPFAVSTQPDSHFFEQHLQLTKVAYLLEHRVQGVAVFPASAYVEMTLAAARQVGRRGKVSVAALRFHSLLTLAADTELLLQTVVTPKGEDQAEVCISSRRNQRWQQHATGTVRWQPAVAIILPAAMPAAGLDAIRERCSTYCPQGAHYQKTQQLGGDYGPAFQGVSELWVAEHEVLARVTAPPVVRTESSRYALHPAWLDACLHAALGATSIAETEPLLPISIERLELYQAAPASVWVHIRLMPEPVAASIDIAVFGEDGHPVLQLQRLRMHKLTDGELKKQQRMESWLLEVVWRRQSAAPAPRSGDPIPGDWLVFTAPGETSAAVLAALRQRSRRVVEVRAGQAYRRLGPSCYEIAPDDPHAYRILLKEAFDKSAGAAAVVHLWSLATATAEQLTPAQLAQDLTLSCRSGLHLVHTLLQSGWRAMPRLFLITQGSQAVAAGDAVSGLSQSALWGLGQSIILEHPALSCTRVDLGTGDASEIHSLLQELQTPRGPGYEEQVALRGANRYFARLVRGTLRRSATAEASLCRSDASYLISGGLSGLGLATAEWLVAHGARHLILLARTKPSEAATVVMERLQTRGVRVHAAAVDVAQHAAVAELFEKLWGPQATAPWPPLRGVVHSAAVLDDGVLLEQSWERFLPVLLPKLIGAFTLHTLTRLQPLDFFVSYSSVASLLGSPGQSNYVAANAFVDALAHHQQGSGRPGLSVNWGLFSDVAITIDRPELSQRLAERGMATLTPAEGLQVLEPLLRGKNPQAGVTKLDLDRWGASVSGLRQSSYWGELLAGSGQDARSELAPPQPWRTTLLRLPAHERRPLMVARVVNHLSQILRLQVAQIDQESQFVLLGMDSLMAVQLRNLIDLDIQVTVPITFLLKEASAEHLADYLLEHLPDTEEAETDSVSIEEGEV